jgi:hypothetical protein
VSKKVFDTVEISVLTRDFTLGGMAILPTEWKDCDVGLGCC